MTMKSTRRSSRGTEEEPQDLSKFPSENPNPVLRIARDGTLLYVNAAGLSLLPQWHLEVGHASPSQLGEAVFQSMDTGTTQEFDCEHGERVYSFFVAPIVAARYANLYARDITEQKRVDAALRESEARFRDIVSHTPDHILLQDRDLRYRFVINPQLGLTEADMLGKTDLDFLGKEDAEKLSVIKRKVLETGEPVQLETALQSSNGEIGVFAGAFIPTFDATGKTDGIIGYFRNITERKRTEEALRESDARFRAIASHTPDHILLQDRDLRYQWVVNPQLGLTEADMIGKTDRDFLAKEDAEKLTAIKRKVLETGEPFQLETSLQSATGQTEFFAGAYIPTLDATGKTDGLIGYFRNITERKRAEEALRASEGRFRQLFDNISSGAAVFEVKDNGDDFVFVDFNKAGERLDGERKQDLLGKSIYTVRPGIREFGLLDVFRRVWETGIPEHYPAKVYQDEKRNKWYDNYVYRLPSGEIVAVYDDVTEREREQEALRNREELLQRIFDILPVGLWFADKDGKLLRGNPAGVKIWGAEPRVALADSGVFKARRLPSGKEVAPDDWALAHTIRDKVTIVDELLEIDAFDGKKKTILNYTAPVLDAEGEIQGAIVVNQDITERKRTEERMRTFSHEIITAREEERKQVSSVLHHDVGSLAVGVSAHLNAIEEDLRSGKPGEALRWTKRTRRLFNESVARLKEVAVQLRPPELDLLGLRAALRQHFSQVTKHGRTRIHFRETLGPRRVSGDTATTLFRAAQEALTNAITHGDAKRVDVFLSASKKEVKLTVRDNGRGFSSSGQKGQAKSQMGLRVMKEMAASCGGGFRIHSRRGKGTTVRVNLPYVTAASRPADTTVRKETVARATTIRSAGRRSRPQNGSGA